MRGALRSIAGAGVAAGGIAVGLWLVGLRTGLHGPLRVPSSRDLGSLSGGPGSLEPSWAADENQSAVVARVERTAQPAGGERLRGESRFALPGSRSLRVSETAEVDASGRLLHAEVRLVYAKGPPAAEPGGDEITNETFDAVGATVKVTRASGQTQTRAVPNALPWFYLPVRLGPGAWISTPVAASVARRAAETGQVALRVAAYEPEVSLTSDQFAVSGSDQEWVVLGDDLATFAAGKAGGLLTLHVAALGLELRPKLDLRPQTAELFVP